MKKTAILILLIVICACTTKTNNTNYKTATQQTNCQSYTGDYINKVTIESIDTAEFIVYWKQFRKAILERDTATLSAMINDSIEGDFICNKSLFLNNLDTIFTPEFISLLKSYEIDKYLGNDREIILWKLQNPKTYACITFDHIQINPNEQTSYQVAYYTMYYERDEGRYPEKYVMQRDCPEDGYFAFELIFVKSNTCIKLYQIDKITKIDVSDSHCSP